MIDSDNRAEALRAQIEQECQDNLKYGRRTHRFYMSIVLVTVGSSALSAILALGFSKEVDERLIGVIALVPGICAGVADRFHLMLKKHWFYRKYDKLNALLRRMDFVLPRDPSNAEIGKVAKDFCRIDLDMSRAWEHMEEERPIAKPEQPA